ncbi:MAG: hypothetical protein KAW56_07090 [Candidatus Marinimicrobia bacterium]|nr:hypothetical protein [Candidatus Neomarinimicrobiota bacterium]
MEDKLRMACFKFTNACMEKLEFKERQGYTKWDDPNFESVLKMKLENHTKKKLTQENLIDISNFCDFLWNLIEDKKRIHY